MKAEAPKRTAPTCANCKHFRPPEGFSIEGEGRCQRYPPVAVHDGSVSDGAGAVDHSWRFPSVEPGEHCGEWAPRTR